MKTPYIYMPSELTAGESEFLRQHAFTKWLSGDVFHTAADFLKKLGLLPIYAEYSSEKRHRYLLWRPPEGHACEVRSGRTMEQFIEEDNRNIDRGWGLLTLQINAEGIYSAVWAPRDQAKVAEQYLKGYGITLAHRMLKT